MPFGRSAKPNNRSQHNLVESAGPAGAAIVPGQGSSGQGISPSGLVAGAGGPGQAQEVQSQGQQRQSPSSALDPSNNTSFVHHPRAVNHPPLPHLYTSSASTPTSASASTPRDPTSAAHQQHALNTANPNALPDSRVRKAAHEFVDAVARSQSQRHTQVATPIQPNPSYGASYEDLTKSFSPQYQSQQQQQQQQQQQSIAYQQQHQPGPPVESRRSTRRLIKNILAGTPNPSKAEQNRADLSHHHHSQSQTQSQSQSQSYYSNNSSGLARRPSKRVSNPPTLRTGPSQVSLDQQSIDWQPQGTQHQPSPLLQGNPHDFQQATLRRVPTGQDTSPYSDDGGPIYQQGQVHIQTQLTPDQQQQLGQVTFDPATRQYQFITRSPQRQIQPEGNLPGYSSHLSAEQHRNSETISQLSHDSPGTDGDYQASSNVQSTAGSPAVRYSAHVQDLPSRTSSLQPLSQQPQLLLQEEGQQQEQHQSSMVPPAGGSQARGSQDNEKSLRGSGDIHSGPPPSYRHSQQPSNNMNPLPAVPQGTQGQNSNFRPSSLQDRQQFDGAGEQGRNSPQPSEDPEKAFKDLLTKYKNVKRLYFDGKTQIEALSGQVEQLQNAVANQRITQSRTALDDNEYTTRFNRLNGAIKDLSFNIRKDWVSLPGWLDKYASADALKTGKQEMTAVGRAVITGWLVEEIFHGCFHPGLDPALSRHLKEIEQNIRRFSYTLNSQEEHDALTSKVVSWRMTTLDGLQHVLNSEDSANYRQEFTRKATSDLVAYLFQHLADPPPSGVDGSASMIVELAVGIAANLPLESRDVAVVYPLPQDTIQPSIMEIEKAPLPAIDTRSPDGDGDADSRGEDNGKDSGGEKSSSKERNKSRAGMSTSSTLSSLLSNASSALVPGNSNSRKGSVASVSQQSPSGRKQSIATSLTDSTTNLALPPKDSNKVRFAGFMAVEVRGRQVLVKAPVWTLG